MIKERKGNLLQEDTPMIAHQVNCQGVMGAGIARQIRKNLLTAGQYREYQQLCKKNREAPSWCLLFDAEEGYAALCGSSVCRKCSHRKRAGYRI